MEAELNKLHKISELVMAILAKDTLARDDDKRLYLKVCEFIGAHSGMDVIRATFAEVMLSSIYPTPETVRRARQKIQADYPDLRGMKRTERMERQEVYKEFAKEKGIV